MELTEVGVRSEIANTGARFEWVGKSGEVLFFAEGVLEIAFGKLTKHERTRIEELVGSTNSYRDASNFEFVYHPRTNTVTVRVAPIEAKIIFRTRVPEVIAAELSTRLRLLMDE
jgi:hypothetical protein